MKLHDVLVKRLGLPADPKADPPAPVQYTEPQWIGFIDQMRERSSAPMGLSRETVQGATDAAALRDLMACSSG